MKKTYQRIALAAILLGSGYFIAKYQQPITEVVNGLYNKTVAVVRVPFEKLYDWATDKKVEAIQPSELENTIQQNETPIQ